ncbi:MAG: hypothetical protein AB1758_29885 [Candidatus Eremiobacterota bacterium]
MLVFYHPRQSAANNPGYSPSAGKPALFVDLLARHGLPVEIQGFEPASREDLCRAHDPAYVDGVLSCRIDNGFGNRLPEVADSLPYTSGSLLAAARAALAARAVTCSPTSGFHHAGYDFGEDYCTFNGLMVTALALRAEGLLGRVAVLDCDFHFGNGTEDIVDRLECREWCLTSGERFVPARDGEAYLRLLDGFLDELLTFRPDLILYQAGADAHMDDPLGGVLTSDQLLRRDQTVFARLAGLPLAWNLAGGYQRDPDGGISRVLDLHLATCRAALCLR